MRHELGIGPESPGLKANSNSSKLIVTVKGKVKLV